MYELFTLIFRLPRPLISNADVARIINSDEVQSALRDKIPQERIHIRRKNPLKNLGFMVKLNPHAKTLRRRELLAKEKREKAVKEKRNVPKKKGANQFSKKISKANEKSHNIVLKK